MHLGIVMSLSAPFPSRKRTDHPRGLRSIIREDGKTYTDQEFALILTKASEMARTSDAGPRSSQGLSLHEMKAIAEEVGLDPSLVERAARQFPMEAGQSRLERILGGPVKYSLETHFDRALSEEDSARLLSAVRAAVEQRGEGQADSSGMSWRSVGDRSQLIVTAHTDGDRTRVRYFIDRGGALVAVGKFTLLGTIAAGLPMTVAYGVLGLHSQAVGWSALAGVVLGGLTLGRTVWASTTRTFRGRIDGLMDAVNRSLEMLDDESKAGRPDR